MPNILALTDRQTGKHIEDRDLIEVDELLCHALGVPVSPETFYKGWVDWMGLYVTNDWAKVQEGYKDLPERKPVLDWLEKHYTLGTYAIIGKR